MTARIMRLDCEGEQQIFVPGTDPAEILAAAAGELDTDEEIFTQLDDVKVGWWRVNPCSPENCWDDGRHHGHWTQTGRQTRGGFQGAAVTVGFL